MISYRPKKIFLDPTVKQLPITKNILSAFPQISVEEVEGKPDILKDIRQARDPLGEGKKHLWITRNRGKLVKKCGAATSSLSNVVCCNYFILDFSFNCHFECVYCFLQEYTNLPMMVVYANIDEMLEEVSGVINSSSQEIRIGTGEMADSLALDDITGFSTFLVPFFAKQKNAYLELKTKSTQIENLLRLEHNGRTVIAWSLSPPAIAAEFDIKTASIEDRLKAAKRCSEAGYKVAFHLDPIIYDENWKQGYRELIDQIYEDFEPSWISLGALRYNANLKSIVQKRFPRTRLTTGEFIPSPDGKKRYLRPIREEMYKTISGYIQEHSATPTYLCMESGVVWNKAMGYTPQTEVGLQKQILASV